MTTTEKLIKDCNLQIKALEEAKQFIEANRPHLDRFNTDSSLGIVGSPSLYLHQPYAKEQRVSVEDIKAFCRSAKEANPERTWERETNGKNSFNYNSPRPFNIHIFDAEPVDVQPLDL